MVSNTKSINLCFGTNCSFLPGHDSVSSEQQYQNIYKPFVSALYNLPDLPFTMSFSGPFLDWIEHTHPEFFMILEEMISRKQLEVLGGGYYMPFFPLIPPADRVGQLELMTTTIRTVFGKKPRGAWINESAWEPTMVSSLHSCGMEYILLDRIMLQTSGASNSDGMTPVTVEDCGKTVTVLPLDNKYRNLERFLPEQFTAEIQDMHNPDKDQLVVIFIEPESLAAVFDHEENQASWFELLFTALAHCKEMITLSNTGRCLKTRALYPRAYISSGVSPYAAYDSPGVEDVRILCRTSIKHQLISSPAALNLYSKMMYVHVLVNQLRGDKSRKKTAREELWKSQAGPVYRSGSYEPSRIRAIQSQAYKNLLLSEKATRLRGVFSPSIISTDFDMDGLKEYLCQLDSYSMYVHQKGGKVFEFDSFSSYRNYCTLCEPGSGLFIDHFFGKDDLQSLQNGQESELESVFADTLYQETATDSVRHELSLKTTGIFGIFQQPLSLRKQYSFRNEGIQVQYILKNESPLHLSGTFAIELDLVAAESRDGKPLLSVYSGDNRAESELYRATFSDVSWLQLTDAESGVKFTLESNENPSASIRPVFCRTLENQRDITVGARIFLYWNVDLGPNYETEKMVFLKIDA